MPRQVQHLHNEVRAESEGLAADEPQVYRNIRPHGVSEPILYLRRVVHIVGGVPAVALAQDSLAVLDPGYIRGVCAEVGPRRLVPDGGVAAEVVDVGVGVEDEVEVARTEVRGIQVRQYHLIRGPDHAGVDEQGSLAAQKVLREGAWPQDALDPVYARRNFHFSSLVGFEVDGLRLRVELRRVRRSGARGGGSVGNSHRY